MIDSTRHRNVTDFFFPIGCYVCKRKFKTIDQMNAHKEDNQHKLMLGLADIAFLMQQSRMTDHTNG